MAGPKSIPNLPAASALTGSEQVPIQSGSSTVRTTTSALADLVIASSALQSAITATVTNQSTSINAALSAFSSATQQALTTISASVAALNTAQTGVNNTLTDHTSRLVKVESLVIPNSGSAPTNSVLPTLTGTLTVGSTLTIVAGTWSGTITSRSYIIRRGGTQVYSGPIGTYVVQAADGTSTLTVTETVKSAFPDASATSIGYAIGSAPAVPGILTAPSIAGAASVGQTGTLNRGTYTNSPTSYTQQWYRSGVAISGATSTSYAYQAGDAGLSIYVIEIASNGAGAGQANQSSAVVVGGGTAPAYDSDSVLPGIKPGTYQVGQVIQGDPGSPSFNPDPSLYTYQWYRDGVAISGATSINYTAVNADGDKTLQLGVIARNAAGAAPEERTAGVYIAVFF